MSAVPVDAVEDAAGVLRSGGLVAFPTETVYGLGADATNADALRRLYEVKGRPTTHPVIVHLAAGPPDDVLAPWAARVPAAARALAARCWPGPLTLVLPRSESVRAEVTGGRDTVGLRVPDQPVAQQLLARFGSGVAAPSANRFGRVSPTTAAHVRADLGADVDCVLDGGPCRVGVESTVVDCSEDAPVILRLGGVTQERVESIVGGNVPVYDDGQRPAPGTLPAHYAPDAEVVVVTAPEVVRQARHLLDDGLRIGLLAASAPPNLPDAVTLLRAPADVAGLARELYGLLREADQRGLDVVLAVAPPRLGLGAAVADRLDRAAHPRERA